MLTAVAEMDVDRTVFDEDFAPWLSVTFCIVVTGPPSFLCVSFI